MTLLGLPSELLLVVADFREAEGDINSLAQTNRNAYSLPNPYLYRRHSVGSGSSALLWAVRQGQEGTARRCISERADVVVIDGVARTPLSRAAGNGHEGVVRLLLAIGRVDVDSKDLEGRTPCLMLPVMATRGL